jgi:hypothetical protein
MKHEHRLELSLFDKNKRLARFFPFKSFHAKAAKFPPSQSVLYVWSRIHQQTCKFIQCYLSPIYVPFYRKQNRPNSDTTPRRWSVPQKLNVVSFKLETTQGCNDDSVNESTENAPTLDEQIEENKSHKFINYLEEYCGEILKTRRDNFVDLKGFKEQVCYFP